VGAPRLRFENLGPPGQTRLIWKPLDESQARGDIYLYKVQWRKLSGDFTNVGYVDGAATEYLITTEIPEPGTTRNPSDYAYEARIIPRNSVGWPENKEALEWFPFTALSVQDAASFEISGERNGTHHNMSSGKVVSLPVIDDFFAAPTLEVGTVNASTVSVRWIEPRRDDEITVKGFRLSYSTYLDEVGDMVMFGPWYFYGVSSTQHMFTDFGECFCGLAVNFIALITFV